MARFSPVREMACKAIVAGSTPARVSDRPVAQMDRASVAKTAGRRFEYPRLALVFTLLERSGTRFRQAPAASPLIGLSLLPMLMPLLRDAASGPF